MVDRLDSRGWEEGSRWCTWDYDSTRRSNDDGDNAKGRCTRPFAHNDLHQIGKVDDAALLRTGEMCTARTEMKRGNGRG